MSNDQIILPIKPESWVRIVSGKGGDHVLFNIPEICIKGENGESCDEYMATGLCKHTLSKAGRYRKRRIERYNAYRINLFHLAKQAGFMLPVCGFSLYFYLPIPPSWSKKKRELMHGQLHQAKPDTSNLQKAWEDSLTSSDEGISQLSGCGKFWFSPDKVDPHLRGGYIEIKLNQAVYNPFGVKFLDPYRKVPMEDILESREKRNARKKEMKELRKKAKKEGTKKVLVKKIKEVPQKRLFKKQTDVLK